jgi:hypothetical protein
VGIIDFPSLRVANPSAFNIYCDRPYKSFGNAAIPLEGFAIAQ